MSAEYNSDCSDAADTAATDVFSRQNSSAPSLHNSHPSAADDLASPIAKRTGAVGDAVGEGHQSCSFLGIQRDGTDDASLALDFSVGTFAGATRA